MSQPPPATRWRGVAALLLLALQGPGPCSSEHFEGVTGGSGIDRAVIIGKFCVGFTGHGATLGHQAVPHSVSPAPEQPGHSAASFSLDVQVPPSTPQSSLAVVAKGVKIYLLDDEDSAIAALTAGDPCLSLPAAAKASYALPSSGGEEHRAVRTGSISQHLRPRMWWTILMYVVLGNCGGAEGEQAGLPSLQYDLHFLNRFSGGGHSGSGAFNDSPQQPESVSFWKREFGCNQQGLNVFFFLFCAAYSLFLILAYRQVMAPSRAQSDGNTVDEVDDLLSGVEGIEGGEGGAPLFNEKSIFQPPPQAGFLRPDHLGLAPPSPDSRLLALLPQCLHRPLRMWPSHLLLRLYMSSLLLQYLFVSILCLHYAKFTVDGRGLPAPLVLFARLCLHASRCCFVLLLCLLARGFAISTTSIQSTKLQANALAVGVLSLLVLHAALEWTAEPAHAPDAPSFFRRLAAASAALAWMLLAGWFGRTVSRSFSDEYLPLKRRLLKRLGLFCTPWLLCPPAVLLLALLLDPWVREKSVAGAEVSANALALAWMGKELWQSSRNGCLDLSNPNGDGALGQGGRSGGSPSSKPSPFADIHDKL